MTRRLRDIPLPVLGGLAALVFLVSCTLTRGGLASGHHYGDVDLYELYGRRVLDGKIPYRSFFVEYPPGSLPAFVAPAIVSLGHYVLLFKLLMALCGTVAVLLVARIAGVTGMTRSRAAALLAAIALAPFAVGPVVVDEFDLWPTAVTVAALLALVCGRCRLGGGLLGFAAATKVFPLAILPVAVVWFYRRSGRREAQSVLVAFLAVAALTYAGFVAVGAGGVWYSTLVQLRRGLQKESFGSAILLTLDQFGLYKAHIVEGNGNWTELTGSAGNALALLSSLCQVAVALGAAALVARRRPTRHALLLAATTAVAGFVAFGKILSPQYLIWLVPLVPLVAGVLEVALLAAALVLTQLWFLNVVTPFDLGAEVWIFVTRDALLLALTAVLFLRLRALSLEAPLRASRTAGPGGGYEPAGPT